MVNPYQPPTEASAAPIDAGSATAEFRLSERHLRFAESKYLLFLYGGRLTFASLAMIALPDQLFCFVPKSAAFSVNGYRAFLQVARRDARVEPMLG